MDKLRHFFKNNWEHFAAVSAFIILAFVYFSPILSGYSLTQHDIKGFNGMAKELNDFINFYGEKSAWSNGMFAGMPTYFYRYPIINPIRWIVGLLHDIFSYPISVMIIASTLFYFLSRSFKASFWIALFGALAFSFTSYNIIIIQAGHITKFIAIAFFPGVLLGLNELYTNFTNRKFLSLGILTFFVGTEIMAFHIQMTYYFAFVMLGYFIYQFIKHKENDNIKLFVKKTIFVLIAGILGVSMNISRNILSLNYSEYSMRGGSVLKVTEQNDTRSEQQRSYDKINKTSGLDRDYITHWSYGIGETYNLLIPNAKGSNAQTQEFFDKLGKESRQLASTVFNKYRENGGRAFGGYFGDQPGTSGPNYIGAIVVFLALLYILLVHNKLKWALLAPLILTILLSWGKNLGGDIESMWLTNFFIDYIPMYSKFRTVSSILVISNFIAPLMAVLFLHKVTTDKEWAKENLKKITIFGSALIGVILLIGLTPDMFFDLLNQKENQVIDNMLTTFNQTKSGLNPNNIAESVINIRKDLFLSDTLRALQFIVPIFILLILMLKGKFKTQYVLILIASLSFIDLWSQDKDYLNNDKVKGKYTYWEKKKSYANVPLATKGDFDILNRELQLNPDLKLKTEQLKTDWKNKFGKRMDKYQDEIVRFGALNFNTNYRVMDVDNPFNSSRASYFHKSTGGYSPAKLRRYQDIIDYYISKELRYLNTKELDKMKVLNMLNNKYYLYNGQLAAVNPHIFGNAWYIKNIKSVNTSNEEIESIANINPKETAIIHTEEQNKLKTMNNNYSGSGNITMSAYKPNHITYSAKANGNQLAVFSEIYYPEDWKAYIDGEEVNYFRVNYILRGLEIPNGEHKVEFIFKSEKESWLNFIVIGAFILLIAFFVLHFIKKK